MRYFTTIPIYFILLLVILLTGGDSAAEDKASSPLELIHSDNLELNNDEDNLILNLNGNIHFRQDSTDIFCGRALWYKSAGVAVLIDSVFVDDGQGSTLNSDRATYYKNIKKLIAIGNVVATSDSGRTVITGRRGLYLRDSEYVEVTGEPKLTSRNEGDTSDVVITAVKLEYYGDEEKGIATDSVEITKGKLVATGGIAEFYKVDEYAVLYEDPKAVQEDSYLTGDTIKVFTTDEEVERISVEGNAVANYEGEADSARASGSLTKLSGKRLDFYFTDEEADSALVMGTATSYYRPATMDTLSSEINEASGDTIKFYIEDEDLDKALIIGGARGTYRYRPDDAPADSVVEDTVRYSARWIEYQAGDSSITLDGNSNVTYQGMNLRAHRIVYATARDHIFAEGDSVHTDDSSSYKDPPILTEGEEKLVGYKMEYNIKNKKGRIVYADTEFEGGYYHGEDVRKITDEVLYVKDGVYSTCNLLDPHYCFKSRKMKLIARDKVVARPVIMYIGELPVAALPYYVFPIKKGRHSGFTAFEIGNIERGELFIRNVGYYWAASDYWDLQGTLDYYEDSHTALNGQFRYAKRYKLNGNVSGSYVNESRYVGMTKTGGTRWQIRFNHSQTINETTRLAASGSFMSDKRYMEDLSYNPEEIRNRNINSHVSLSKSYDQASLTVVANQNWNLDTDVRTENLPSITYSRRQQALIPFREPREKGVEKERSWYNDIYYSYSMSANNYRRIENVDGAEAWREHMTANHQWRISAKMKFLGVFNLTPGANYRETWYYIPETTAANNAGVETATFKRRGTYSLSTNLNTTLYGMFNFNAGLVDAIRHIMTPSATYSWSPEFKSNEEYYSFTGVGGAPGRVSSISLGLSNAFQMKGKVGDKEYKTDLFNINFSTGHNFLAEGRKWSNLSTSIQATKIKNLSLSGGMTHTFYDDDPADVTPDFLHPRLLNFNITGSFSMVGRTSSVSQSQAPEDTLGGVEVDYFNRRSVAEIPSQSPWNVSLTGRYVESRFGSNKSISRWLGVRYESPITAGWRMKYNFSYDVDDKRITDQELQITRNLHCWEMVFIWRPSGIRSGYFLRINVLELPDVKVETSEGGITPGSLY